MHKPRSFAAFGILPFGLLATIVMLSGCEKSESITTATVPKHESLQSPEFLADFERTHPKPNRMIGVVIPRPEEQWFFKLEGQPDAVAARENDVREFLKSVSFRSPQELLRLPAANEVEWNLPTGWQKLPGNEMRYATLVLDGQPHLEMSVSKLPSRPGMPIVEQVVANINRWRNQLSLPPIEDEDLRTQSEILSLKNGTGYLINIVGRPKPRPAGMGQPQRPPASAPAHEKVEKADPPSEPLYEKPEQWTEGVSNGFAVVSLQARDGESQVKITVTSARGNRLENVNRWRGQLRLDPISDDQLQKSAKKVDVGSLSGELFEMSNEGKTIFGVIVEDRGQTWFVKLHGDQDLAERERTRFEAFLKSLHLS